MNVEEMPLRCRGSQHLFWKPIDEDACIVRQYHPGSVSAFAELHDGIYPGFERQNRVDPKAVHPDTRTVANEFLQIIQIGRIPRVSRDSLGFSPFVRV